MNVIDIERLNRDANALSIVERLRLAVRAAPGKAVFTTSFGLEDQLLTHHIARAEAGIDVVTLDTGRLFPETYDVWAETERAFNLSIRAYYPNAAEVEGLVAEQGVFGFRESLQARKACCGVRKVEPLGRALAGATVWVTGLRAGQSAARARTPFAAWDSERNLLKVNPLYDVSGEDVSLNVHALEIPYNVLHDQGFPSIGCQPCTRAVRVGEEDRAGRWWWETSSRECGLHPGRDEKAA